MKRRKLISFILILLTIAVGISSCKDDNGSDGPTCTKDYDQSLLLTNMADSLIIPSYQALQSSLMQMDQEYQAWKSTRDETKLSSLRAQHELVYSTWQYCSYFGFGPAEEHFLGEAMNNFPLNEGQLITRLQDGKFSNNPIEMYDRGLPAWDYILFGSGLSDTELTDSFLSSNPAQNYMDSLMKDLLVRSSNVLNQWSSYRAEFIDNQGNSAGTSLSLLLNYWNKNYEVNKRDRLGIPSGVLTLAIPNPSKVEAVYSSLSKKLLDESLSAAHDIFWGNAFRSNTKGEGFDDILNYIDARSDGQAFSEVLDEHFTSTLTCLQAIPESNLQEAVNQNNDEVISLYSKTAKQLIHTKTSIPSLFCISITYIDNPSDSD